MPEKDSVVGSSEHAELLAIQATASLESTLSQKKRHDLLRYNFNAHQPILIIFGRDIAE